MVPSGNFKKGQIMTTPVSTRKPPEFISLEQIPPSKSSTSDDSHSLQQAIEVDEVAKLRKQIDQKDEIIKNQSAALKIIAEGNKTLKSEIEKKKENLESKQEEIVQLETSVFALQKQVMELRKTQPVATAEIIEANPSSKSTWQVVKNGASKVGRFCSENHDAIETGLLLIGGVLCWVLAPHATAIVCFVGAGIKFFSFLIKKI